VLAFLNDALLRQEHVKAPFVSVAMAILTTGAGGSSLEIASAGHPRPLLLEAGGAACEIGERGTLLGVASEPRLSDSSLALHPGDHVVMYTDGLTDARAPAHIIGEDELMTMARESLRQSAGDTARALQDAALAGVGQPRDDVAILVLRAEEARVDASPQAGVASVPG
jgi:serine phosphatase RsbU (regulator of sigma subunit)